jgi:hypothetical protein
VVVFFYQDDYQKDLTNLIQTNEHSLGDTQEMGGQEVDGETRLSLWVDVAGEYLEVSVTALVLCLLTLGQVYVI